MCMNDPAFIWAPVFSYRKCHQQVVFVYDSIQGLAPSCTKRAPLATDKGMDSIQTEYLSNLYIAIHVHSSNKVKEFLF